MWKWIVIGVIAIAIAIAAFMLIKSQNAKYANAQYQYAYATEAQGTLADWWTDNNPFNNAGPIGYGLLPSQAECDKANKTGGFCISTASIVSMIGG